jgi:hypothetical protein
MLSYAWVGTFDVVLRSRKRLVASGDAQDVPFVITVEHQHFLFGEVLAYGKAWYCSEKLAIHIKRSPLDVLN